MSAKQSIECAIVRRFLVDLGASSDSAAPRDRPDVEVVVSGRRIGIEVTVFHSDETANAKGSLYRQSESKLAGRNRDAVYSMNTTTQPELAISSRIIDKAIKATGYETNSFDEIWLLIAAQIPEPGAIASTYIFDQFLNCESLTQETTLDLNSSVFSKAFIYLMMNHAIFQWDRGGAWSRANLGQERT